MSRFIAATSIGLALAIAIAFGAVGWRLTTHSPALPELQIADPETGFAFYAVLNNVLGGADGTLDEVVTPDFVDHARGASAGELVADLTAFGRSFPGAQLKVRTIEASASSLVVSLAPIAPAPVPFAGAILSTQPFDGGYEVLRIHNGKVAERWAAELPALSATTFAAASFSASSSTSMAIRLDRIELPNGSELKWQPGRTTVLLVESGSVRAHLTWAYQGEAQKETKSVHAGEALLISSEKKVHLERDGDETARLLIFSMRRVTPMEAPAPVHSGGATSRLLWTSNLPLAQAGQWSVAFGNVLLPELADISFHGIGAMEVLICTESAETQMLADGGDIESLTADLTAIQRASAAVLHPGSAAHLRDADSVGLRTDPGATGAVWLITISPEIPVATPSA